jgi:hypothetical protein
MSQVRVDLYSLIPMSRYELNPIREYELPFLIWRSEILVWIRCDYIFILFFLVNPFFFFNNALIFGCGDNELCIPFSRLDLIILK